MYNDSKMLAEAYKSVVESMHRSADYYEDALKDPKSYELTLNSIPDEDWEGNLIYRTVAYITKLGDHVTYDRVDNADDIDALEEAFEKHNPEGMFGPTQVMIKDKA